jgi:hypothetical protein
MGFKVGPGYFAIDGRYKYDFNSVTLKDVKGSLFKRQGFNVMLGYELWL